jgi:site-specific recombinase XerD
MGRRTCSGICRASPLQGQLLAFSAGGHLREFDAAVPVVFADSLELAADFAKASKAPATRVAYASDWQIFEAWCAARGLNALPASPAALCAFLADQATLGKRASTLSRRLASIKYFHSLAGEPSPTADEKIKATLSGIRRSIGAAPVRKRAATSDIVLGMVGTLGNETLRQLRDRALLLVAFASAMRRSELVALDVADLEWTSEGVLIRIRKSKTDQEGMGAAKTRISDQRQHARQARDAFARRGPAASRDVGRERILRTCRSARMGAHALWHE